jgi:hypothetical protein
MLNTVHNRRLIVLTFSNRSLCHKTSQMCNDRWLCMWKNRCSSYRYERDQRDETSSDLSERDWMKEKSSNLFKDHLLFDHHSYRYEDYWSKNDWAND